ncbi:MAG: hypothetical protein PHO67_08755 [Candidatus Omnitrophica bacterium]|nr:hypothetical protein [Candidatus Omnitrophota bacterium]
MKCFITIFVVSMFGCRGAYTPLFELVTDEDTETDYDSEKSTETVSDTWEEDNQRDSVVEIQRDTYTEEVSDSDMGPDTFISSDSESEEDSESDQNSDPKDSDSNGSETEVISDSDEESETVTSSDSISDAGFDTDTESDESNTTDDISACPGSCQYNRFTKEELEATGLLNGFSIDPSVSTILLCDNGSDGMGFETFPIYSGWIRDNAYQCDGIGRYCCRPQNAYDQYCSEIGGTCAPSATPGEGAGFCAFASNECKEISK